jgi:adenylate cyclase
VADDRTLASEIQKFDNFVGAVFLSRKSGSEIKWPEVVPVPSLKIQGLDEWIVRTGHEAFPRASFPVQEIAKAAGSLANVHLNPDFDSVYRSIALFEVFDGKVLPSLALAGYLGGEREMPLKITDGRFILGGMEIPIDSAGRAVLNFRGPSGTHKSYCAASILQSELRLQNNETPSVFPDEFRDAHVLFGFSAPGLYDLRPTPVSGVYPGVEISATMLDNLLAGDFIRRVPTIPVVVITLIMVLLAGVATSRVSGFLPSVVVYFYSSVLRFFFA